MSKMNKVVMTLAGLLLIVAAVLKFQEMLSICIPSWQMNPSGFWESYEFLLVQIPLEFALGVWLVSGLFRKGAWIVGTLAYLGFIFVTLFQVITGAESCGCFGQVHVDPRITLFAIDIPFFLLLAIFYPKGTKLLPPWPNTFYLLAIAVPTICLMVLSTPALVAFKPDCIKVEDQQPDKDVQLRLELRKLKQELAEKNQEAEQLKLKVESLQRQLRELEQTNTEPVVPDSESQGSANEVIPRAADQGDQTPAVEQWDWLQYVIEDDVRDAITQGMVVVFMYHHDCPTCAEMAPKYSDYYRDMTEQGNDSFKIAFLAIPPYGEEGPIPEDTLCIHGKLTDEEKWEVASPYLAVLLDGELIKTWPQGTAPEPDKILDEVFGQ